MMQYCLCFTDAVQCKNARLGNQKCNAAILLVGNWQCNNAKLRAIQYRVGGWVQSCRNSSRGGDMYDHCEGCTHVTVAVQGYATWHAMS